MKKRLLTGLLSLIAASSGFTPGGIEKVFAEELSVDVSFDIDSTESENMVTEDTFFYDDALFDGGSVDNTEAEKTELYEEESDLISPVVDESLIGVSEASEEDFLSSAEEILTDDLKMEDDYSDMELLQVGEASGPVMWNGHFYMRFDSQKKSWSEARDYCTEIGGHLVTITSEMELNFLKENVLSVGSPQYCYWIGLSRATISSPWTWVTGESYSFSKWSKDEPNNDQNKGETCVQIFGRNFKGATGNQKYTGDWNDATNTGAGYAASTYDLNNTGFICEWESSTDLEAYGIYRPYAAPVITNVYNSVKGGDIRWNALSNVAGYKVYRLRSAEGTKLVATINDPSITQCYDTTIRDNCYGRVYHYFIKALYKEGNNIVEGPASERLVLQRLAPVKISRAVNNENGKVGLTWACTVRDNKALGYEIQYATSSSDLFARSGSFKAVTVNGRNNLTKTISGMSIGKTYWIRVRCYVNYEHSITHKQTKTWSEFSNVVSLRINK